MEQKIIPLFNQKAILNGIKTLAEKLNQHYQNTLKPIVLVGILKGCLPFLLELIKHLKFDLVMDFMIISSYAGKRKPLTEPRLILDTAVNLKNQIVLIIDDIIESGKTMQLVINHLKSKQPQEIKVVSLIYKAVKHNLVKPDFHIFKSPTNLFLVGFGLDIYEQKRNLPFIGYLKEDG